MAYGSRDFLPFSLEGFPRKKIVPSLWLINCCLVGFVVGLIDC